MDINNQNTLEYNVCILGASLDTGNMGVSALAASVIKLVIKNKPAAKIQLVIGNRSDTPQALMVDGKLMKVDISNYRMSPKASLEKQLIWILFLAILQKIVFVKAIKKRIIKSNKFLNTLYNADFIGDIRGGDSFSDIYGLSRFIIGSIPDFIILLLNKELTFLPQTYGPYNNKITKYFAKYLLENSKRVVSRDKYSGPYISKIFPSIKKDIIFCPDVAFTLEIKKLAKIDTFTPLDQTDKNLLGININGLMYNGGYSGKNMFGLNYDYKEFIKKLILELYEKTNVNILLVPHTFGPSGNVNSDPDASNEVYEKLNKVLGSRLNAIKRDYNQHEIKGIIRLCNFFIGSRMHSCIAALSQGIPTVGVAYSKKFIGVFNAIDFNNYVVDARKLNMDESIQKIIECFDNKDKVRNQLQNKTTEIQAQINNTFMEMLA